MSDTELLLKPKDGTKPEPVRRVEVFTGTGRRRRWSVEQKTLIVAESHESGVTVSEVARRHGLTVQQLFAWRRNAQREQDAGRMTFAPVMVQASQFNGNTPVVSGHCGGSSMIEIAIGAATVRVPTGTDVATLHVVLRAVAMAAA